MSPPPPPPPLEDSTAIHSKPIPSPTRDPPTPSPTRDPPSPKLNVEDSIDSPNSNVVNTAVGEHNGFDSTMSTTEQVLYVLRVSMQRARERYLVHAYIFVFRRNLETFCAHAMKEMVLIIMSNL
mmetsp:Transcript_7035/g.8501  ORF Transcript_7035/g.8501 Transcript_7035/m.8501 type:complete len:124 (+) Transcript_7035:671-1042(+)